MNTQLVLPLDIPSVRFTACAVIGHCVICKSTHLENYIPVVMSPLKHTSLPSTVATFLTTCLMTVLQPSGYSVFHDRVTPISISTLKPPLGVIGVLPLKPQASPILSVCI